MWIICVQCSVSVQWLIWFSGVRSHNSCESFVFSVQSCSVTRCGSFDSVVSGVMTHVNHLCSVTHLIQWCQESWLMWIICVQCSVMFSDSLWLIWFSGVISHDSCESFVFSVQSCSVTHCGSFDSVVLGVMTHVNHLCSVTHCVSFDSVVLLVMTHVNHLCSVMFSDSLWLIWFSGVISHDSCESFVFSDSLCLIWFSGVRSHDSCESSVFTVISYASVIIRVVDSESLQWSVAGLGQYDDDESARGVCRARRRSRWLSVGSSAWGGGSDGPVRGQ